MNVDWIREGESTKIIDLGFKKVVSPKILIKFVLKNIKNIYIHKYKINTLEWPSVVLGIKALRGLAAPPLQPRLPDLSPAPR